MAAADLLCSTCRGVDWTGAGLPRVSPATTNASPGLVLFNTSAQVRGLDGIVAPTADARPVESALLLVSLGTVGELQHRRASCRCCAFCFELLERRFAAADIDRARRELVPVHVYTRKFGVVVGGHYHDHYDGGREGEAKESSSSSSSYGTTHLMCFNLSFHPDFHHGETASFGLLDTRKQQASPRSNTAVPSFVGRLVSPRFDPEHARHWLETCERQHTSTTGRQREAESFLSRNGKTTELRVVEIAARRIATLRLEDIEGGYAALSYVWGVAEQAVRLTTANLEAFSKPGGVPKLSQTVEDAMQVARSVGIAYFWADVVSILQDDEDDKAQNIADMDVIYTYSRLTVAAVAGTNCHEGLPGVSYDRVPLLHTTFAAAHGLVEIPHQPERPVESLYVSRGWPSRAWTLQEFLLSRQTLLFCEQQVIWVCRTADWAEGLDVTGEKFRFAKYDGLNRPRLESAIFAEEPRSGSNSHNDDDDDGADVEFASAQRLKPDPTNLADAAALIECYTRRQLSYESDIKNALEGLMWYISSMSTTTVFLWGLPEPNFEGFLCWSSVRGGSRPATSSRGTTTTTTTMTHAVQRRLAFPDAPSWSWMAWLGPVRFPQFATRSAQGEEEWRSLVKCFKYPTYLHRQGREWNDILSGYGAEDTVMARPFDMWQHRQQQQQQADDRSYLPLKSESASIVFWGPCTTVLLDEKSLDIHPERLASSVVVVVVPSSRSKEKKKRLRVQNLCVSEDVAQGIFAHAGASPTPGSVSVTLAAVAMEGSNLPRGVEEIFLSDRGSRQHNEEEEVEAEEDGDGEGEQVEDNQVSPAVVFDIWDRTVHCLVLSRRPESEEEGEGHFYREGVLSMNLDDWLGLEKEVNLVVVD
ncbi:hypothetical protein AYO20_08929 [Fonsecaea nubica]|uniref:Heterokaryon incompatibility domain-containing protein n=1 Tax=Fonsecaea nubica TaxID=856822 RepID=A0A178CLD0_9EURO|nr:hypothetical protein AYO20_08929 [Fonsecaea nubica]OAL30126.1 hypothetical protein AYO20_08929 [Fonsecaea nubica]